MNDIDQPKTNIMTTVKDKIIASYQFTLKQTGRKILKMFSSIILFALSALITFSAFAQNNLIQGQTFRDCASCPDMVVIPAGSFMMGSPDDEAGRNSDPDR